MLRISHRAAWDLTPNTLTDAVSQRQSNHLDLLDLIQSNPTTIGIDTIDQHTLLTLANKASQRYEPTPKGLLSAREAVASWYCRRGIDVQPGQLLLTASSSESYGFLLKLLCDPGDSVLVPAPSYPLFDQLARLECVSMTRYPLIEDDGWRIDEVSLRQAIQPNTKAIFLVSPNNPTGSFLHEQERRRVEDAARDHDLALICDEVFAEYVWNEAPDRVRCAAIDAMVPTFSLGGLSKSACLPQMKLGWIVVGGTSNNASDDTLQRLEMIADTYLSVSASVQHAAKALLDGAAHARDMLAQRIRTNLSALRCMTQGTLVSVSQVDAGWYACLRVPSVINDDQWAAMLVREDGLLVHPGSFFGVSRTGMLVIGLIAPHHMFVEGVRRLLKRVERTV